MNSYPTILTAIAPVFLLLLLGLGLRKADWLSAEADGSLMKLVIRIFYPCLILDNMLGNPALTRMDNLSLAPPIGFLSIALGFALAYPAARLLGLRKGPQRRTFTLTTGIHNYVYIPFPLIAALFEQSRETLGVLFVYGLGVETAFWTLGIMIISGLSPLRGWKKLCTPPLLAILAGLALNLTGTHALIPAFLEKAIAMPARCAVPLALLLSGATLADCARDIHWKTSWRVPLGACLLRLGVLPLLFILMTDWLPCSTELKRVLLIQAAMPAGIFPIVVARHYGGHNATAVQVVIATSLLSLVLIPFWIAFGFRFAGLV